jgi:hypothetical protein
MSGLVDDPARGGTTALDDNERLELERLRAEVAALRAQPAGPATARRRVRWASVGAAALLVIGCLLVPSAGRDQPPSREGQLGPP